MIGRLATSTDTTSLRRAATWQRLGAAANTWLATAQESNVEHIYVKHLHAEHIYVIKSRVEKLKTVDHTGDKNWYRC